MTLTRGGGGELVAQTSCQLMEKLRKQEVTVVIKQAPEEEAGGLPAWGGGGLQRLEVSLQGGEEGDTHLTLAEQVGLSLPSSLLGRQPLQRRRRRRRLIAHLQDHMLAPDWWTAEGRQPALGHWTEEDSSPGQVKGQRDVQRRALEAVLRTQAEPGRLSLSVHGDDLQVFGVQSLHQITES